MLMSQKPIINADYVCIFKNYIVDRQGIETLVFDIDRLSHIYTSNPKKLQEVYDIGYAQYRATLHVMLNIDACTKFPGKKPIC